MSDSKIAQHPALAETQIIMLREEKEKLRAALNSVLKMAKMYANAGNLGWTKTVDTISTVLEQTK